MTEIGLQEEVTLFGLPDPEIQQMMGKVSLEAFIGPSRSGKDTIMDYLQSYMPGRFARVVGDTSRPPRKNEIEGATYHFRSKDEIKSDLLSRKFVQVALGPEGNFYGTRPEQYPTERLAMMAIMAREIPHFRQIGFKVINQLLIVPHSDEAYQQWQNAHGHSPASQRDREVEAVQSYVLSLADDKTRYILNDEVEKAAERVIRVVDGKKLLDETLAKQTAFRNLEALKARLALT